MNGIINIYKEKGFTSHDVVAKLRGMCRQKKIGHTGTLDPDAEGVLPVCLGTSTKVCGLITDQDKEYDTVLLLGIQTDTQDISGTVQNEHAVSCTEEEARLAINSFIGDYAQIPPMYSAIKVNGKKLYDLARAGIEIERKARTVRIFDIQIKWIRLPRIGMLIHCSKGTYIRTLCHDIGQKLGCGGCMESLLRTRVSIFSLDQSFSLAQVQDRIQQGSLQGILIQPDELFTDYPKVQASGPYLKMLKNGNRLPKEAFCWDCDRGHAVEHQDVHCEEINGTDADLPGRTLRVYLEQEFFGIYTWDESHGDYRALKIFWQAKGR